MKETLCVNCNRLIEHVSTSRSKVWTHADTGQMLCQPSEGAKAAPTWAEASPEPLITLLCIRDPDASNDYVCDRGELEIITIDVGGSWADHRDFCDCLRQGDDDAVEYEKDILEQVEDLPADNVVRLAVEEFFQNAREG